MTQSRDPFEVQAPSGPLTGVRIIDLTSVMFGPFATMMLGDAGATIYKIEPPGGEINRHTGESRTPGMSTGHLFKSRNKRSVVIDLKEPEGIEILRRLCTTADVLVHNMRPQASRRLGIGYDTVRQWNPDLIYAEAVGFGAEGPYAERPAYDDLIQGMAGIADLNGRLTGTPAFAPTVMADKTSGLYLLSAITMALFHRERTGQGQRVTVPMFECMTAFMLGEHLQGQSFEPPTGPTGYARLLTPHRRPHATLDGYVCVLPYNDRHWRAFFDLVGQPELAADERFATQGARSRNINALYAIVAEHMATRTTAEWLMDLAAADIPSGPMYTLDDALEDPHLQTVGLSEVVEHPTEGAIRQIRGPVTFGASPGGTHRHAETLGASTRTALAELGYTEDEIKAMLERGIVEG